MKITNEDKSTNVNPKANVNVFTSPPHTHKNALSQIVMPITLEGIPLRLEIKHNFENN